MSQVNALLIKTQPSHSALSAHLVNDLLLITRDVKLVPILTKTQWYAVSILFLIQHQHQQGQQQQQHPLPPLKLELL